MASKKSPVVDEGYDEYIEYPAWTKKGYMEAREGDGLVLMRPAHARGTVQKQSVPTLTTTGSCGTGTVVRDGEALRIRQLTPRECWRLMGQTDEAYDRAAASTVRRFKNGKVSEPSKTALYKAGGNSIVVDPLADIFDAMYNGDNWTDPYPVDGPFDPATANARWAPPTVSKSTPAGSRSRKAASRNIPRKMMFEDYPPDVQQAAWNEMYRQMKDEWRGCSAMDVLVTLGASESEAMVVMSGHLGAVSFDRDDGAAAATVSALTWDDSYWLDACPSAERWKEGLA